MLENSTTAAAPVGTERVPTTSVTSVADALADVRATLRALVRGGKGIDQLVQRTAKELAALGGGNIVEMHDLATRCALSCVR